MIEALGTTLIVLAAIPLVLGLINLLIYRPPPAADPRRRPSVSVLIPARDEERRIGDTLAAVLASEHVDLEVLVGDDHSTDGTAALVTGIAERDPRVRLVPVPPLPAGWSGKQHACAHLAEEAQHDILVFLDAEVAVAPDGLARTASFLSDSPADLVSGFPRQVTVSFWERLVVPLIHLLLLGYLPMAGLRWTRLSGFAAGCGQLIAVNRNAYRAAGGHGAIRTSLHDGIKLPQAFRRAGYRTDLFDATGLAACRMYESVSEIWSGFGKNATEGMATPVALPIWTVLLGGGHVLPFLLLAGAAVWPLPASLVADAMVAVLLALALRAVLAVRFRQSWLGVLLHPVGVLFMLALQWTALVKRWRGRQAGWRGREYQLE